MGQGRTTSLTLRLTPAERRTLLAWQRATTTISAGRARRGRILLPVAEQSAADTLFDRLLALNRDAFAVRRYPTAYYALVAAMCEAEAAQEVPALVLVQTVAEAQAAPGEHPVASPPTSTYSTLFTLLAKRIQHRVVLIQRWRLRHDRPPCC